MLWEEFIDACELIPVNWCYNIVYDKPMEFAAPDGEFEHRIFATWPKLKRQRPRCQMAWMAPLRLSKSCDAACPKSKQNELAQKASNCVEL